MSGRLDRDAHGGFLRVLPAVGPALPVEFPAVEMIAYLMIAWFLLLAAGERSFLIVCLLYNTSASNGEAE